MTNEEALEILKAEFEYETDFSWKCDAYEIAIKAIEKQIPKKPILILKDEIFFCPRCSYVCSGSYCKTCGQRLDWGDGQRLDLDWGEENE